jgi:hypothetical protein
MGSRFGGALWCYLAPVGGEWYTNAMTSHSNCTHPATKAARAKCRKSKAAGTKVPDIQQQPHTDDKEAAKELWEAACKKFAKAHIDSAIQNADDTTYGEKLPPNSKRWYEVALLTLHSTRNHAELCEDYRKAEEGQRIELVNSTKNWWIDEITRHRKGRVKNMVLIDDEGYRQLVETHELINPWETPVDKRDPKIQEAYSQYIGEGLADTDFYFAPMTYDAFAHNYRKDHQD